MKELKLKVKREYYNIFKELTDRQAGELIKGMCAYTYDNKAFFTKDAYLNGMFMTVKRDIDEAKRNSINGNRSIGEHAAKKSAQANGGLGIVLCSVLAYAAAENGDERA